METKKVMKRLLAVGAGSLMLGATAMGALAADLKDYPAFFVKDGSYNGYLVVGEKAAAVDNLAMTDIAAGMKFLKAAEASATATVSGDAWMVGTSAKKLEMSPNSATAVYENFRNITTYIGKDELKALADGSYSGGKKSYSYKQYLYFNEEPAGGNNGVVRYAESDLPATNDKTADYLYFANGKSIAKYKLEFTSPAESDVASNLAGTTSTSGAYLSDLDNTKINLLGKEYSIVLATRPTSGKQNSIKLTLMSGAASDTLAEGDEKTYTLDGKEYKVKVTYVDDDEAKFTVNGEVVDKMQAGQTKKLSDGKEIGVSEILYQAYAGGVHSASFFLGASKLELQDDTITDSNSGYEVVGGSETIDGAHVIITGTDNNVTFKINTIEVNMTAEDDLYIAEGGKLSDAIVDSGNEKEVLFTNNFDVEYKGLTKEKTHDIKLYSNTDRKYFLKWFDGDNKEVKMPLAYAVNATILARGESNTEKRLIHTDNEVISKDDYFVVTGGTEGGAKGESKSYLFQYKGADNTGKTSPKIKFKNVGSGETLEYSVAATPITGTTPVATIKIGGYSCQVHNASAATSDDFSLKADVGCDDNAPASGESVTITDYYGAQITLQSQNVTGGVMDNSTLELIAITATIDTPSTNDWDDMNPPNIVLNVTATSGPEVRAATPSLYSMLTPEGMTDVTYGYTTVGGKLTFSSPSGSPNEFTYAHPEKQILPQVYFTSQAGTASSSSAGGSWTAVAIVDATKLDSEVLDTYKEKNLIVVGGPCVNTVAAALLGSSANCADGFTPGKSKVKLFENGEKVAMLVAGYSGDDTRVAGKFVASKWKELSGKEMEIETATSTASVPVAKVEVAAPAAATTTQ